jgi:hypothetical protein
MKEYKCSLEKNSRKHICPQCNEKRFVKYIYNETGEYVNDLVGRCDRESSCRYHFPPNKYFHRSCNNYKSQQVSYNKQQPVEDKKITCMDINTVEATIGQYGDNTFVQGLIDVFGQKDVMRSVDMYKLGTLEDQSDKIIFWQFDKQLSCRGGKVISYNRETLKRDKEITWMHTVLRMQDFNLSQCLFGEHLIRTSHDHVIVVESEKSAIVGSIVLPDYVWVATGGKSSGVKEKLISLKGYTVTLIPDIDAIGEWKQIIQTIQDYKNFTVSDYLDMVATEEQRNLQYDIADFLLLERRNMHQEQMRA